MFAPSIVYDHDDPWVTMMRRLTLLPVVPVSGEGQAAYQPIWADDVARCILADLSGSEGSRRFELAGPETLTYDQIARVIARSSGRDRPLLHVRSGSCTTGSPDCGGRSATPPSRPGRRPS